MLTGLDLLQSGAGKISKISAVPAFNPIMPGNRCLEWVSGNCQFSGDGGNGLALVYDRNMVLAKCRLPFYDN
jgi:hypothetical protein